MPHVTGRTAPAVRMTGGNFTPDYVPNGIDARGGFKLFTKERNDHNVKNSEITLGTIGDMTIHFSFYYSEVTSGVEDTQAGCYYGVRNIKEL